MSSSPRPAVANANGHNRNENLASVAQATYTRVSRSFQLSRPLHLGRENRSSRTPSAVGMPSKTWLLKGCRCLLDTWVPEKRTPECAHKM